MATLEEIAERDAQLIERMRNGEVQIVLAREYGMTRQRINQIARKYDLPRVRNPEGHTGCIVPGCTNKYRARGYCNVHHHRWLKGIPFEQPLYSRAHLPTPPIRHGTPSGYRRCVRTDEGPCDQCRKSNTERGSARYHRQHPGSRYYVSVHDHTLVDSK